MGTKMKKRITLSILILSLVVFSIPNSLHIIFAFSNTSYSSQPTIFALVPHSPITVVDDGDFSAYGFPGTGEEINPYIIEE